MSIANLLTANVKADQNLDINDLTVAGNLTADTLTIEGDIDTDMNVQAGGVNIISASGIGGLQFPTSPYNDLLLTFYGAYSADVTWSIYSVNSGPVLGGLEITKIGVMAIARIYIFSILDAGSLGAETAIVSDAVLPLEFRPFDDILTIFMTTRMTETGIITPVMVQMQPGVYSFQIVKFDGTPFNNGAIDLSFNEIAYFSYITAG